jgi:hypothetical protein
MKSVASIFEFSLERQTQGNLRRVRKRQSVNQDLVGCLTAAAATEIVSGES